MGNGQGARTRRLRAGGTRLGLAAVVLALAAASSSALAAGGAVTPKGTATNWVSTWSGSITATPAFACEKEQAKCPNPFAAVVDVTSATGGTVVYSTWKCKGVLKITGAAATSLQVAVTFTDPGPFGCADVTATLTSIGPGYASWSASGEGETYSGVLTTPSVPAACQGAGSCGVTASRPQVICLSAATCPPGGVLTSTVTVAASNNGATEPNAPVSIHFLSTSHATTSGSWCQGANGTMKTGRTNAEGLFQFSYTSAGPNTPSGSSFCMMRVTIGGHSVLAAIDQTNDPAPWVLTGSPTRVFRTAVPSNHARLGLTVKNPNRHPGYVNGDPTTFYSEIPSIPGACGSFSPLVRRTGQRRGRAVLVYSPSTVWATRNRAFCTLIGEEADTGAISNKIVVFQRQ